VTNYVITLRHNLFIFYNGARTGESRGVTTRATILRTSTAVNTTLHYRSSDHLQNKILKIEQYKHHSVNA